MILAKGADWGSVPDWVGAALNFLAFTGLVVGLWWEIRQRRRDNRRAADERRDAEAMQARLVFTLSPHGGSPTQIRAKIRNSSAAPVLDVVYDIVRGDTANPRVLAATNHPTTELPDGATAEVWFNLGDEEEPMAPDEEFVQRITFTDSNGLRWRRMDNSQPERIISP